MVRIKIRAIGKIKEPFIRDAIADYAKRMSLFCQVECAEYPEAPVPDSHPSTIERACVFEGEKLCSGIDSLDYVIVLDRAGKQVSSEGLAEVIRRCEIEGPYQLVFIIGGPHGLSKECLKGADIILSLSALTFPHQIARLLLYEQLYRAFTIIRGLPYHR
ncbi:23S rRNA (pseudouridine(1915)-N(3))-methyltransferase RlmH [Methanospirillum hungatei]|uniref:23S rRNA (pseudouridine(1915)-N(3))-methyltransferase RlmH n=1 Tax=Methanospirillum hungatei TaxID=2203 RepID=UPI0026F37221|nr:23S rRNA (pseudouridine(1915)-N(3))-methyltransferase RlmH [Methanospirillum hungatei]MCA1915572.1 23S rRNA (pseudouridine(1915)-N(3))-methyltransferase RlmH [Methanospirillum hungatei]